MGMKEGVLRDHTFRQPHLDALLDALNGYGVVPGQEPTVTQKAAGADMSVDVSAFQYFLAWIWGEKTGTSNVAIDTSDATNPRVDTLFLATNGNLTILKGTAGAVKPIGTTNWHKYEEPYPADYSEIDGVLLAEILVPAGATSIVNANIRNIAVPIRLSPSNPWAVDFEFGDGSTVLSSQSKTSRCGVNACKITAVHIRSTDGAQPPTLLSGSATVSLYVHNIDAEEGDAVDTFSLSSDMDYSETGLNHPVAAGKWVTVGISNITACKHLVISLEFEAT